jgi:hypothetical protein
MPSVRERLTRLVIGSSKVSRQDFNRKVGITSRVQEASEEDRMVERTSSGEARVKLARRGGGSVGVGSMKGVDGVGNADVSCVILSPKNFTKSDASMEGDSECGSVLGLDRDKRRSRVAHSSFGFLAELAMSDLKYDRRAEVMSLAT